MEFKNGKDKYALWIWKGDYWNLHSGAEIGLYKYYKTYSGTPHYEAIEKNVPMRLSLYQYQNSDNIQTVFNWAPNDAQWWITGFSGTKQRFKKADRDKMAVIGNVNLKSNIQLYKSLKKERQADITIGTSSPLVKYLIFDDENSTVWVYWYEGIKY